MIGCNHDNWRCIKIFSKVVPLTRKHNVVREGLDDFDLVTIDLFVHFLGNKLLTLQKAKLSCSRGAPPFSNSSFPWNLS